jgi:hypothetical protein
MPPRTESSKTGSGCDRTKNPNRQPPPALVPNQRREQTSNDPNSESTDQRRREDASDDHACSPTGHRPMNDQSQQRQDACTDKEDESANLAGAGTN